MSGLERTTPLRSDPSHTFPEKGAVRTCEDCGAVWRVEYYDDPPPWPCPGLKRSGLQRNKRVNPVSETNSGREHQKDEAFRGWVRGLACVSCGSEPPNDPHHRRSRGAGFGDWLEHGTGNLLPLCRTCHQTLHHKGVESFQYEQGINLEREAERIGERYREEEG